MDELVRTEAIAVVVLGLHLGCHDAPAQPRAERGATAAAPPITSTATPVKTRVQPQAQPHPALRLQARSVEGRSYNLLSPHDARWAITLRRPSKNDLATVLAVPGTYTSRQNVVEGMVMLDGQVVQQERKPWEAILRVEAGAAQIRKAQSDSFSAATLDPLRQAKASLLQGHLLVHAGKERPLRPSPQLQRRALASMAQGPVVIESQSAVPLAQFAADLVSLGGLAAMNLDMGAWSEGWYRTADSTIVTIGDDRSATERQSNWIILRARSADETALPKK